MEIVYIPGVFMHAQQDPKEPKIIILLQVLLVKLLDKVAPNIYQKYTIIDSKGETVLYFEM